MQKPEKSISFFFAIKNKAQFIFRVHRNGGREITHQIPEKTNDIQQNIGEILIEHDNPETRQILY